MAVCNFAEGRQFAVGFVIGIQKSVTLESAANFQSVSVFFPRNFYLQPKWQSSIGRCRKICDHPQEHLAKSDYKSEIKSKYLIILLYFWLHNENQIIEYGDLKLFFSSRCRRLKTSKITSVLNFEYRFLAKFRQSKRWLGLSFCNRPTR